MSLCMWLWQLWILKVKDAPHFAKTSGKLILMAYQDAHLIILITHCNPIKQGGSSVFIDEDRKKELEPNPFTCQANCSVWSWRKLEINSLDIHCCHTFGTIMEDSTCSFNLVKTIDSNSAFTVFDVHTEESSTWLMTFARTWRLDTVQWYAIPVKTKPIV